MIHRRNWLKSAVAFGFAGADTRLSLGQEVTQKEVPWLEEIQTPPERLPADAPMLYPLCVAENGSPLLRQEDWEKIAGKKKRWWLNFLGVDLMERRSPPKLEVLGEDREVEGVVRQWVRYKVEPDIKTEAYLCKPAGKVKNAPALVAFHSTVDHSILQPAGLKGEPEKAFGVSFAKRGYVVLCPRNFLWPTNTRISAQAEAEQFMKRQPTTKGMGKMLLDGLVAVDLLASLPEVDASRIGAVGHSLGAKEVLYLAAFDPRIKASVSSEGGIGTAFSNWHADWYLGKSIQEKDFRREHHELLALVAPRAFLLIGGESADGDRGWPFIAEAKRIYELYGKPARIGQFNHRKGHAIPPEAEKRIEEWFAAYL